MGGRCLTGSGQQSWGVVGKACRADVVGVAGVAGTVGAVGAAGTAGMRAVGRDRSGGSGPAWLPAAAQGGGFITPSACLQPLGSAPPAQ